MLRFLEWSFASLSLARECLIKEIARMFIPIMTFLLQNLVLSSFLVLLRYSFLIYSIPSVISLFPRFMVHFSMPNSTPISLLYILIVCIGVSNSFSVLKQFDVIHVHKVINFFLWFCKFVSLCTKDYAKLIYLK